MGISNRYARYLCLTGVVCFFSAFALSGYFVGHRPAKPNSTLGLMFAFNQHGTIVYLARQEQLFISALPWASIILVAVAAAIEAKSRADLGKLR